MKKLFFITLLASTFNAYSQEMYLCTTGNLQLELKVQDFNNQKYVQWTISLISDENTRIEGNGLWQKENESEDAFSAYNDDSAISYKNQRAIFVNGTDLGNAILFPVCEIL